jgi:hypothetical protein
MLLQKTLQMSYPVADCKARLLSLQSHGPVLMEAKAIRTSSKTVDFSFRGPLGFQARTVLFSVESESPNEWAFESAGGNIGLLGSVEFIEILPRCTEIRMVVHCEIRNRFFAWLDRRIHFMDTFVTSELRSIWAHFEGMAAPDVPPATMLPIFEAAAA